MASWRPREPPRIEAPEWYRNYHSEDWQEPDGHEQAMIDGCSGSRCWPGAPLTARWPDWPEFLHDQHARRRWEEAKYAYRRQNPALASQEFADLVNGERAARRAERRDLCRSTIFRMSDPDASEAARSLNRARWGDSKVRSAIATLAERRAELGDSHKAQLREIADGPPGPPGGDGDGSG